MTQESRIRFIVVMYLPLVAIFILMGRLYYLQVWHGDWYLERSQNNFIQQWPIVHNRGLMLDQTGLPLADNRPAYDLYITRSLILDEQTILTSLGELFGLNKKELRQKIKQNHTFYLGTSKDLKKCEAILEWKETYLSPYPNAINYKEHDNHACSVYVNKEFLPDKAVLFKELQKALGYTDEQISAVIKKYEKRSQGFGPFRPILFTEDISYEAYAEIQSAISAGLLLGVSVTSSTKRRYIYGSLATHVMGFLNEVSKTDLEKYPKTYRPGDRIGRRGLEKIYEPYLRGKDGVERFVVDAKGRRHSDEWRNALLGGNRVVPPEAGNNLTLSLDYRLQKIAEEAFLGKAGSVVAIDPHTGFILAMASFPAYDPNLILGPNNHKVMQALSSDPLKPWLNKAIEEHYAPGSTFKAITAIAGFENDLIKNNSKETCRGTFYLGNASWRCFKREGHGNIDLVEALKTSCDVFFYKLGHALGTERLAKTARLFGFGQKTGIDLDRELPGIIPDTNFYLKHFKYNAPGFVVNSAIGQGAVTITALQLAVAYSTIVNGGITYKPQIVKAIETQKGQSIYQARPKVLARLKETEEDLKMVKEGLSHVMEPGGTAYGIQYRPDLPNLGKWLRESGIKIGGKTGTAQVVRLSKSIKHLRPEEVDYEKRDHAWFVSFAPIEKPEIVVVVMTEHGGFGGTTSAPVAAQITQAWFEQVRGQTHATHP